ncbi:MAG: hypothetical protein KC668_16835 [Myxococcales bacterium]|nr:hypothetical protein [Myxococcales bacterium]
MLISCPECERKVSDRAVACPDCAFPIAEELREVRAREAAAREALSREEIGVVDCPPCAARGFRMVDVEDSPSQQFEWCARCERSGRSPLVRSDTGFFAVSYEYVAAFVAGGATVDAHVIALGADAPPAFRYPSAGPRVGAGSSLAPETPQNEGEKT